MKNGERERESTYRMMTHSCMQYSIVYTSCVFVHFLTLKKKPCPMLL